MVRRGRFLHEAELSPAISAQILDLLADMKRQAKSTEDRVKLDTMAVGIITQDIRPQVMAHSLTHWFNLHGATL